MPVGRESVLVVWADWSYFVYLGVFDNQIVFVAFKARHHARSMERGVGRVSGMIELPGVRCQVSGVRSTRAEH